MQNRTKKNGFWALKVGGSERIQAALQMCLCWPGNRPTKMQDNNENRSETPEGRAEVSVQIRSLEKEKTERGMTNNISLRKKRMTTLQGTATSPLPLLPSEQRQNCIFAPLWAPAVRKRK